jgi:hypothetical protein
MQHVGLWILLSAASQVVGGELLDHDLLVLGLLPRDAADGVDVISSVPGRIVTFSTKTGFLGH